MVTAFLENNFPSCYKYESERLLGIIVKFLSNQRNLANLIGTTSDSMTRLKLFCHAPFKMKNYRGFNLLKYKSNLWTGFQWHV